MYVCVKHACSTHRGQKRAPDPPELELQMVVSLQGGARTYARSSRKAASALNFVCVLIALNIYINLLHACKILKVKWPSYKLSKD